MTELDRALELMRRDGQSAEAIAVFLANRDRARRGNTPFLRETDLQPVKDLPVWTPASRPPPGRVPPVVVIKLNGGLGTSMGLEGPKSLLPVRAGKNFLDLIVQQILSCQRQGQPIRFLLMNSFNTRTATLAHLQRYPQLAPFEALDLMQSRVPKLDAQTWEPIDPSEAGDLAWCPPGHGDLYPALRSSGQLQRLVADGFRCAFVSNADNLGAFPDPELVAWFLDSDSTFAMEVCRRTESDRKGGHLARRRRDGQLILRESAQCAPEDQAAFQDHHLHRFFNTNNLWLRLDRLQDWLDDHQGCPPLPVIINRKPLNPRDPSSRPVLQLETAMGSAIEFFPDAQAIEVPRSRFAPVKTTNDLLVLRSDACIENENGQICLHPERHNVPPHVDLDPRWHRYVDGLDQLIPAGPPSLLHCQSLLIRGPLQIDAGVILRGRVEIHCEAPAVLAAGTYEDVSLHL